MSRNSKTENPGGTAGNATVSSASAGTTENELTEFQIRMWFMKVDLEQARDTFRVVEGIIQTREQFQPARKKRSDAGKKRNGYPRPSLNRQREPLFHPQAVLESPSSRVFPGELDLKEPVK